MKPIKFILTKTSNRYYADLLERSPEFIRRVKKSLEDLEVYLEGLAEENKWEEIVMTIPTGQVFENGILINDILDEDRMFLFETLNENSVDEILDTLYNEHKPQTLLVALQDSLKG